VAIPYLPGMVFICFNFLYFSIYNLIDLCFLLSRKICNWIQWPFSNWATSPNWASPSKEEVCHHEEAYTKEGSDWDGWPI
jgi:hypothetical protein